MFRRKLKIELDGGVMPYKGHKFDAGFDLAVPDSLELAPSGVIDAGYTGHIKVVLVNRTSKTKLFAATERVAQLVVMPVPSFKLVFDTISEYKTLRGKAGFGSSGRLTEV